MRGEADILIYALGGGMGHVVRSSALARAIYKQGKTKPLILATPGFTRLVVSQEFKIRVLTPPESPSEYRSIILKSLARIKNSTIVVDALPMGLMGELRDYLPRFEGKKILIARYLRKDYRRIMGVDKFVRDNYNLVIRSETLPRDFLSGPRSITVPPILAMDPSALPSRTQSRDMMNAGADKFLAIAVGSDSPERTDEFFEAVHNAFENIGDSRVELRYASPYGKPSPRQMHTSYYPLMELLPAADLVIGHAGYHLFHECAAAGAPALLFPRPRLYDDQEARVKASSYKVTIFRNASELEKGIASFLKKAGKRPRRKRCESGAQKAARAVLKP